MPTLAYIVKHVKIDKSANNIPFTIVLPNNVKQVIGVMVNNNAKVNVSGGVSVVAPVISPLISLLRPAAHNSLETTSLQAGSFSFAAASATPALTEIPLNRFALGNVTLRSYERSGQFYTQTILPSHFNLGFLSDPDSPVFQQGQVRYRTFESKKKVFMPVLVDGISTEITGFFVPYAFGKNIVTTTDPQYMAANDFVPPYRISIYLLCLK